MHHQIIHSFILVVSHIDSHVRNFFFFHLFCFVFPFDCSHCFVADFLFILSKYLHKDGINRFYCCHSSKYITYEYRHTNILLLLFFLLLSSRFIFNRFCLLCRARCIYIIYYLFLFFISTILTVY